MTATAEKQKQTPLPDIGDLLFALIIAIPLMGRPSFLFQDGSTGWHLVTGEYILKNHVVPREDIFCYLDKIPGKADKAWVAYEWLSDTIMATLVQMGGLNLLAVVCSCAIGLLFLMIYDRCRREGCHFVIVAATCILGIIASAVHWLARPHLFTFFGVYIFSSALEDYYRRTISSTKLLTLLSLYMLLWVNCHPGFVIGFVLIGIYLAASLSSAFYYGPGAKRKSYLETAKTLAIALGGTFGASLINPNGLVLYQYIEKYLKGTSILANTEEFMSPVFHFTLHSTCLELLFAIFIVGLAITQKRLSFPRLLLCLAFSHLALSAVRNMPLFAIIILPAIAQLYSKVRLPGSYRAQTIVTADDASQIEGTPANLAALSRAEAVDFRPESLESESQPSKAWQQIASKFNHIGQGFDENERLCKMHLLPLFLFIALSITAMMGGSIAGTPLLESNFDARDKPTKTLEYLKKAEAEGTLKYNQGFNLDNWGGYIRYKLGTPVFIDDRADFYGDAYYSQYAIINQVLTFTDGKPGWLEWLAKDNIQWVLVPKDSRLAQALETTDGWKLAAEDPASVLLTHEKPYPPPKEPAAK
ncbi:MAG: hypothetical protein HYX67_16525 [Candidatus Melainabacteria bacterium]|nr:hypothetical protein [Candidatus Melainabacteria bacterium]